MICGCVFSNEHEQRHADRTALYFLNSSSDLQPHRVTAKNMPWGIFQFRFQFYDSVYKQPEKIENKRGQLSINEAEEGIRQDQSLVAAPGLWKPAALTVALPTSPWQKQQRSKLLDPDPLWLDTKV